LWYYELQKKQYAMRVLWTFRDALDSVWFHDKTYQGWILPTWSEAKEF
jgi:hypothetical protein